MSEATGLDAPPLSLELVVDSSGSMKVPPANGLESKWTLTRAALRQTVESLPESTKLGAVYFPNQETSRNCETEEDPCIPGEPVDVSSCINLDGMVPIDALGTAESAQRQLFEDVLSRVSPGSATPTHDALLLGLEQIRSEPEENQRAIILLTDGQPTFLEGCRGAGHVSQPVDSAPIIASIEEAAEEGIATFVVGAPGSEEASGTGEDARPWLSEAAVVGLTARRDCTGGGEDFCHFDLSIEDDFGSALDDSLNQILGQTKPCDYPLPEPPEDQPLRLDTINVLVVFENGSGLIVGRSEESNCEEGYELLEDEAVVRLCPETCAEFRDDARTKIELILGCESAPVRPPT